MAKVAPGGGHRAAPTLKKGKKGEHRSAPRAPSPPTVSPNIFRQTEELQSLLRLRGEEIVSRDNDLAACGEQIVHLEAHVDKLNKERDMQKRRISELSAELEMLNGQHNDLEQKHEELRADFQRLRTDNEMNKRLINSTPGIMPVPDGALQAIRRAQHAKDAVKPHSSPSSEEVAGGPAWELRKWLGTTKVLEILSDALLQPLQELHASEPQPTQLSYVRTLAQASGGYEALVALFSQNELQVLKDLALEVHRALTTKLGARAPPQQNEVCGKYIEMLDAEGALQPGPSRSGLDQRLEGLVGPPEKRVLETLMMEHTEGADAAAPFTDPTYQLTTTSHIEWWFVVDPTAGLSGHVDVRTELGSVGGANLRIGPSGYPCEGGLISVERKRQARPLSRVLLEMKQLNITGRLRAAGVEPLVDAEVIAARLFTGPMHRKYNAVLRALCAGEGSRPYAAFEQLCVGNRYTTTLHALRSAVSKLSKLGNSQRVYRAVASSVVPDWLWRRPAAGSPLLETAARGGVEYGFLSATSDAELAMKSASEAVDPADGSAKRVVLEMHTGLHSRPAELTWLSQYPFERECCFVPGTGHELLRSRVDGTCVVAELQLAVPGESETLNQMLTRLKRTHLKLIDTYIEDMKSSEVPERALGRLKALASTHKRYELGYYNNPDKYNASTAAAVDAQRQVISRLADPSTWDDVGVDGPDKARRMEKAAAYCRRVGRGDVASALHRLASSFAANKGRFKAWRPGGNRVSGASVHALA